MKREIYTADREAGNRIEKFDTLEEAKEAIQKYEKSDKNEEIYTPDFYNIIDEEGCSYLNI